MIIILFSLTEFVQMLAELYSVDIAVLKMFTHISFN